MRVLVTGGCGFIGANFLNLAARRYPEWNFVNVDKLTYAGHLESVDALRERKNYSFEQVDICDQRALGEVFREYRPKIVFHFAAESHVDRSVLNPAEFLSTNVVGTFNLLELCRGAWSSYAGCLFHHVSTDEIYGSAGPEEQFGEVSPLRPSSHYSASKASADHFVRAYHRTYGLPVKITNCSNNYGPYQFPEKFVPLCILNAVEGKALPVYGRGENVRDWLYVADHCEAILQVALFGEIGETYNVGGDATRTNIEVARAICDAVARATGRDPSRVRGQIEFVGDRPGHDARYAIDSSKLRDELGWAPRENFDSGLKKTIDWYLSNEKWVETVRSVEYSTWLKTNYAHRVDA